jgi:hypothetical protein
MKCGKGGIFTLDGVQIPTGPDGFTFTALASTAAYGWVRYENDFPVEKELRLFADGFPRFGEELPEGWSWSSWLLGAGADGQMLTFTGAYGPWKTLKNLVSQYLIKGGLFVPTCTVSTRPRGDEHNNVDPVFNINGWKNAREFAELFPGLVEMPRLAAPATALMAAPASIDGTVGAPRTVTSVAPPVDESDHNFARAIDDDIPF